MKSLGLLVSDKKINQNCILKTLFLTLWPTYATNWNSLNNFGRKTPRDHSCEVWLKSNEWFQRRSRLNKKKLTHWQTTDTGLSQNLTLSTLCSGELKTKQTFLLNVFCVLVLYMFLCCSVCLFLYRPFCHGALKLNMSILFTTFFL